MPKCIISGCKTTSGRQNGNQLFRIPKNDRGNWENVLKMSLPVDARVCRLHVKESDIKRGDVTMIDGEPVLTPSRYSTLRPGSLPINIPGKSYLFSLVISLYNFSLLIQMVVQ